MTTLGRRDRLLDVARLLLILGLVLAVVVAMVVLAAIIAGVILLVRFFLRTPDTASRRQ